MEANELRIGNWLYDTEVGFKDEFQVTSGDIANIANDSEHGFIGIQLTDEWLIKFGFKQYGKFDYLWKLKGTCGFTIKKQFGNYYLNEYGKWDRNQGKIEYVHQLQNLYFALIGNELFVKCN